MKIRLLIICLSVFFINGTFATTLQGNISSNLTLAGSVEVIGDVNISSNVTLTFQEGASLNMHAGASLIGDDGAKITFSGTAAKPIALIPIDGKNWGKVEVNGSGGHLEVHFIESSMGQFSVTTGATGLIEDSYFHDYFESENAIVQAIDGLSMNIHRCKFHNYFETHMVRTFTIVEDCLFQFMASDGIDFDNSPPGTTLRNCTFQYGRGTNIDAMDFGKAELIGSGTYALVDRCVAHDLTDKGVSIGQGVQEVDVRGSVFYNCGAGIAVKDNALSHIYNNTIVGCDVGIELVEKNPGLGGGHGITYNNILWKNKASFYLNSTATVDVQYSDIDDMNPDAGQHIMSSDPLFTNIVIPDYQLLPGSPAQGVGMNGEDLGAIYPVGATFNQQNELTLGVPNPFSIYKGGEQSAIWWQNSASISRINIYFSSDDGNSWQTFQMNVDASQKGMAWTIPNLYSSKCRVKIESATNPLISAQNVLPFVILPPTDSTGLPEFSIGSGYYDLPVDVSITAPPGSMVLYTLDGSDPTDLSPVYNGPIHLDYDSIPAGQPELNITASQSYHQPYSYIRTSPVSQSGPTVAFWRRPTSTVFKAHILRARVYDPVNGLGPIKTHSYFIHPQMTQGRYTLPVVSLVTDPANLFDYYKGIYIPGATFKDSSWTGNYEFKGRASEKMCHFEYFDEQGIKQLSQSVGIRVRGEWIRAVGQKALTVYARSDYDTENNFKYPFFEGMKKPGTSEYQTKYKRFILRNNGNEWGYFKNTMMRDAAIQSLFSGLNFGYQPFRMTVTFINGEYWGIQDIRELNDVRGLQYSYDLEPDSIILMEDNLEGQFQLVNGTDADQLEYTGLRDFILTHDLNIPANMDTVASKMDLSSFADYWIATLFTNKSNADHNKTYWKLRNGTPANKRYGYDGKWRWIANDFDGGFDHVTDNNLAFNLYIQHDSLLKRMLTCNTYRRGWIIRFADLMNSHFRTNFVSNRLTEIQALLEPEMQEHINRWSTPSSMSNWYLGLDDKQEFASLRPGIQFGQLRDYFYLSDTAHIRLDVNDAAQGYIEINSLRINAALPGVDANVYPWEGTYFMDLPMSVRAVPKYGYRFVKWVETGNKNSAETVTLIGDRTMTAMFEWDPSILYPNLTAFPNPATTNEVKLNKDYSFSMFDPTGKIVMRIENSDRFDVTNLSKGIYIIRTDEGEELKFVKM
ncbi:MAG: CotH kinase family protein [Bacteroidetes bacterium]|nr:CotH kinase family protein [Bacteroidota bacterium]